MELWTLKEHVLWITTSVQYSWVLKFWKSHNTQIVEDWNGKVNRKCVPENIHVSSWKSCGGSAVSYIKLALVHLHDGRGHSPGKIGVYRFYTCNEIGFQGKRSWKLSNFFCTRKFNGENADIFFKYLKFISCTFELLVYCMDVILVHCHLLFQATNCIPNSKLKSF